VIDDRSTPPAFLPAAALRCRSCRLSRYSAIEFRTPLRSPPYRFARANFFEKFLPHGVKISHSPVHPFADLDKILEADIVKTKRVEREVLQAIRHIFLWTLSIRNVLGDRAFQSDAEGVVRMTSERHRSTTIISH
jgi:hypothetical protein